MMPGGVLDRVKERIRDHPGIRARWFWVKQELSRRLVLRARRAQHLRFVFVNGLRRSGIHFFINLIIQGGRSNILLCNNVARDQFPLDPRWGQRLYLRQPLADHLTVIIGYEDYSLDDFQETFDSHKRQLGAEQSPHSAVAIVRDPFNAFASRWHNQQAIGHRFRTDAAYRKAIQQLWVNHAAAFQAAKGNPQTSGVVFVDYNRLVFDMDYRERIGRVIGLPLFASSLRTVAHYGGGSSFTGTETLTDPDALFHRWGALAHSQEFVALFNGRVGEIAASLYGDVTQAFHHDVSRQRAEGVQISPVIAPDG